MTDDDKRLWVCPNCGSTSWEPSGTAEINCQCQYYPPIWTQMVRVEVKERPAPSGWISASDPPKQAGSHWLVWRGTWLDAIWLYNSWWDAVGQIHDVTHYMPGPSAPEDVRHD